MSQHIPPDTEQFLARLNAAVDAYIERLQGRRPQGTKTWVAKQLGCDRTTLYKYLDGTNRLPLDTLRALSQLLGLGEDEANTLLFLGGHGVAVPVVATPPPLEPAITPAGLRAALTEALAEALPSAVGGALTDQLSLLTGLLSDISKGQITREDLSQVLADDQRLGELIRALAGRQVRAGGALIDFGSAQAGDITFGDVAGRDINKNLGDVIYGDQIIQQLTPRSVAATPEESAAATARLSKLPTDTIPEPEDTLPPGSWMGQLGRNRQFVGREEDLKALAALLKGGQAVAVSQAQSAVASGLGGIGKTQLAVEFAYRYGRYFAGVFWLSLAQADTIPNEFARLGGAAHLQLFTETAGLKLDEQAGLVRSRLACGLPYLLIFDNCEDPDLVRDHHPGGAARVLITSRNPDWPGDLGVARHPLGVLSREESIALLRQQRPDLSDADADVLANELGNLPLALHLAGRFLAGIGKRLTVARYLDELRSPRIFERLPLREQKDGKLPTGHSRDVARSFALSYERLDRQDTEDVVALKLLARAAHLVPGEVIPAALLRATLEADSDDLDAQLAAEAGRERLTGLGLLERAGDGGLRMHRLIGAYVRQVSDDGGAQAAVERVVVAAAKRLTDAPTLTPLGAFLPTLRGVTDAALPREDADAATLCIWLGRHLDRLGAYAEAQPYLERALAISERVLGAEHPDTATSLNNLAGLYRAQGNYEAARPLYERALALRERVLGAEHPQTATSLNNLAVNAYYQGDLPAAAQMMSRALHIREARLGSDHPDTRSSHQSLEVIQQQIASTPGATPTHDPRERLAPLLAAIARVVQGDDGPRAAVEQALTQLEGQGWMLRGPVARIWAGERDLVALTAGLDEQDTALVAHILELIDAPDKEQ
ncbi:tetratricopeptide repeat protein [Oscillochloris sp. ZM17-4]|uniref:helix-turn-helix domain-containing protein n=1 Tax=Oscillochloris sp. ZM17-4 TaxID=2866714 RepID=UPI001C73C503|nr:helix-turn-helix domain-containing protein [Oscillochloris sp. ZM17-4]MBX0329920.1 tetratricopeptide repeat protein [Oscillochloris sp. ZM17-4]